MVSTQVKTNTNKSLHHLCSTLPPSLVWPLDSAAIQTWHTGSEHGCALIAHSTYSPCTAYDNSLRTNPIRPTSQYFDEG